MTSLRAIIFDLDDTLLVDEEVSLEALQLVGARAAKQHGLNAELLTGDVIVIAQRLWSEGDCYPFCRAIGISAFECLWGKFNGDSVDLRALRYWAMQYREEVFLQALLQQRSNFIGAAMVAQELARDFEITRRQHQRLFPEVRAILEELSKKFKLALLTNGAPDLQREKIDFLRKSTSAANCFANPVLVPSSTSATLSYCAPDASCTLSKEANLERSLIEATQCQDLFSEIVISGEHGIGKPEPAIFHHLLKELRVTADEAMMVGNSLERDIAGARAAGIYSVWIQLPGEKISEAIQPDATIMQLEELLELVKEK